MIKKWIVGLFFVLFSTVIWAKPAETTCPTAANFDIVINAQSVKISGQNQVLNIFPNGTMQLNELDLVLDKTTQQQAKLFQSYLRKELPEFLTLSEKQLTDIYQVFTTAIDKRLGNDSRLLGYIDRLHQRLQAILNAAIYKDNQQLVFNHQSFNSIKVDGEDIAKRIFTTATLDSLVHFSIFKNYSAIKKIAADEWKAQKPALKEFNQQVCQLMENINSQYNQLQSNILINP